MNREQQRDRELEDRYYGISEVSELTNVPIYVLRQWEERFSQLRPKRSRTNRRQYTPRDIAIVQRIKQLHWHEARGSAGVQRQLTMEIEGIGKPKTRKEAQDRIDQIAAEARAMLAILDED